MRGLFQLLLVSTFATLVYTEVVDYGDLKSYESKADAPEGIQPDAIWLTPTEGGFSIVLGKDIRSKVAGILDACEKKDDKCFQDVSKALEDAHLQQDHRLESRQLLIAAATIAEVFAAGVAAIQAAVAGAAIAMGASWFTGDKGNKGTFWSDKAASNAANMPEATPVTISADGSAVATVTKHPVTTALEGKITPSVTVVTENTDGFEKGDLAAILDGDLASRLDEFMQRSKDCQVGIDFDKKNPASRKRQSGGTYGQALCAAQSAMGGATPGGPFNDLLFLAPTGTHFNFVQGAGPALAAANQMSDFVQEWGALVPTPQEILQQISIYVLALAIDTIVENLPLSDKNVVKASSVTASSADGPTSTSSTCPKRTDIICGYPKIERCGLKFKEVNGKKKAVCKDTDLKDCECITRGALDINSYSEKDLQMVLQFQEILGGEVKDGGADPKCNKDKMTTVPSELFSSDKMNIHEHFCEGWNKGKGQKMTVDAKGNNVDPEPQLERQVGKRTPPASTSGYTDFKFKLSYAPIAYRPREGDGSCTQDCNAAFRSFAESCTATAPGRYLYQSGTVDIGCGTFAYDIEEPSPPTELKVFDQKCYKIDEFDVNFAVSSGQVDYNSDFACRFSADPERTIKKGDKESFRSVVYLSQSVNVMNHEPYQFNVWWKDGCSLANGQTEMSAADPLGDGKLDPAVCQENLRRNYRDCPDNGMRGGVIQIGCLMYEFLPSEDKRDTWGDMY